MEGQRIPGIEVHAQEIGLLLPIGLSFFISQIDRATGESGKPVRVDLKIGRLQAPDGDQFVDNNCACD